MLEAVINYSTRINHRCVVMPNLQTPITSSNLALKYKEDIFSLTKNFDFIPLLPCYLTENLNLKDYEYHIVI